MMAFVITIFACYPPMISSSSFQNSVKLPSCRFSGDACLAFAASTFIVCQPARNICEECSWSSTPLQRED